MSRSSKKDPPKFRVDIPYVSWRNKLEMWQLVTSFAKKDQAIMVVLEALDGHEKAEKAVSNLTTADLHSDEGMARLLEQLDIAFKSEKNDDAYSAYTQFISLQKNELSMNDYLIEFEHCSQRMSTHDMKLPDAVLAFKLLDGACLSEHERQMALTFASNLTYANMKSALKRIFSNNIDSSSSIKVKSEAFVTKQYKNHGGKQPGFIKKKQNPLDKYGKISRCVICDSKMHWAACCPHKIQNRPVQLTDSLDRAVEEWEEGSEEVNLILMTGLDKNEIFVAETVTSAIIDTACSKTVCGNKWFDNYVNSLDVPSKKQIRQFSNNTVFKFGDGRKVSSAKRAIIPAKIAGRHCFINASIISDNIPLLLSKASLKRAGTVIDLQQDKAFMFKKWVNLLLTSSGHYCIDISPGGSMSHKHKDVLLSNDMSRATRIKAIKKLHIQFGHASVTNLERLLKNADKWIPEYFDVLEQVINSCDICKVHKKPPARPVVGFSWSEKFNETVAMDLHQLEPNVWYLHFIDMFSRFSSAVVIMNKRSSTIVCFLKNWISIFGAPKKVLSDNGLEFNNAEFHDMCENFNINILTTAACSPWSNGLCERHNLFLSEILCKIKSDVKCDWETALAWALSAKNSLITNNGFSPCQLAFGQNVNLPSVLEDSLPALEGQTTSFDIGMHISALHAARRAFVLAESSEKIRRALRKQTRSSNGAFKVGDKVYYKRENTHVWHGPAHVLGQDGPIVFIRHGGQYVRVHTCRVQHVNKHSDAHSPAVPAVVAEPKKSCNEEDESQEYSSSSDEDSIPDVEKRSTVDNVTTGTELLSKGTSLLSKRIQFVHDGHMCQAKVLSRAGKAKGKYKNAYNIEYCIPSNVKGTKTWLNLENVTGLELVSEQNAESQLIPEPDSEPVDVDEVYYTDFSFKEAKVDELNSWKRNAVYDEVPSNNQKCVSVRWVCTLKDTAFGLKPKARLVARGFEEHNREELDKDSPTCSKDGLRVLFCVAKQKGWKLKSIDIKTAFLQGESLDRNVYLKPPKEANCSTGIIWKLRKCVYGLVDASRSWYERVKKFMLSCGAKLCLLDRAIFLWFNDKSLFGFVSVYVDDFLWAGSTEFENSVINNIRQTFSIGKEDEHCFKYIGLELDQTSDLISVNQQKYVAGLQEIPISNERKQQHTCELNTLEKKALRSKIGMLLWVATQTRPDIGFDVCLLATNFKKCKVSDLLECNKIIRKTQSNHINLKYADLGDIKNLKLVVFTDAAFANLMDGGSQGAYLVFLVGQNGSCNLLSWKSKRIRRVVRSTLAAETLAMSDGLDAAIFLSSLWNEILYKDHSHESLPIEGVTDNHSLFSSVYSTKNVDDKRLRIDISSLREMITQKQISSISWIDTREQLADCLTKKGASAVRLSMVLQNGKLLNN